MDIKAIRWQLKANNVKPLYKPGHATCCRGFRQNSDHSDYCFTLKGFYVGILHPSIKINRRTRRRLEAAK